MKEFYNDLIFVENQEGYTVKEAKDVEEITIPDTFNQKSVTAIGVWAFAGNMKLKKVKIPNSIKNIYGKAFSGCGNLESVIIPKSVESIGATVFAVCEKATIYCEAEEKPSNWNENWNTWNCPVYFYRENEPSENGLFWHYENGEPKKWTK